ncbi:hypothetical protein PtrEW4_003677 [Pyrenophora tritici-repentis]|uniref:Uncharacterized protein n=3 Tax=Pyrenophora tritici-repentis TaxID=45151 RepID=A0A317A607_9PLEO|nr:uncharacterized protein PTRG_03726 [Pyrenophora tritici-repentis Pt-1C-BFP]KAI1517034.1 hypothetical protein Ptr86124_003971 [Pyrenophora tritici-repentis]EDU46564.1 predicted protein [Pyrenophora tritici-repentis Pt-1C-BFP]KAI1531809.1 hypothetical protein PtrSN001C_008191 [Pyrenophora tritici-repentis]KAI1573334.1 hypothetical protein PtrEW7m1_007176 [Pyrenophora tritici-repentis]KAI1573544.1 hypothetical protein PtrEW4_003677 [Pyrenophora tritici-repentis]
MFDKLRGKSPSGHSKQDSTTSTTSFSRPTPPPAYTSPSQTTFASLSLHMEDRLRFLRFPAPILTTCTATILAHWPPGIQQERPYATSHEIKLNGYPWRGYGQEAAQARRLMKALLSTLHSNGWILTLNTDITKTATDKDTLVFRYQSPAPPEHEWCCVAFSRQDRLRFVDAPASLYAELEARLGGSGEEWVKGQGEYAEGIWEFKLVGHPWQATGTTTMRVRELLIVLVEMLEAEGWGVYASIDQKSGAAQGTSGTDTWHCCRVKGWEKGMPVYMR